MADGTGTEGASRPPVTTLSPVARRVAGGRRNPHVVGEDVPAPRWLRSAAGVSWRLLVVVLAVALVFYALGRIKLVVIALFLAMVFTAVLRPLVGALSRFMPRALATALSLLLGILTFVGLLTYVVYSVANQWSSLSTKFGDGITQITDFLTSGRSPFTVTNAQIATWIDQGVTWLQDHAGQLAGQAAASAGSAVEVFTALALAVFCSIFFLARGQEMWTWFLNQLPARVRDGWMTAGGAGWFTFSGYTRGTVIIALTDGLLAFILLSILGVPLAAPLSVLVFIGAFIPLIGAPSAMVVAMIVALATLGPVKAGIVGIGIAAIGQFEGHVLQPLVMGKQVSLHPVVVALAVASGTLTAGIFGAVFAVPLVSVGWAIFSRLRRLDPPMEKDDDEKDDDEDHGGAPDGDEHADDAAQDADDEFVTSDT